MEFVVLREIRTGRLLLRKLRREDTQDYYDRIGSSKAVTRYMLFEPHRDISDSVASIEKTLRRYESGRCYRWGIALPADDRIIGVIELLRFDEEMNSCSFAYMLGEGFWGKGYGTEALRAALNFAFAELKMDSVEADHIAENAASGAVMRKAGMKYQGTAAGKYEKNGALHDAPLYWITAEEWKNREDVKVLVSACLTGENCKYNGGNNLAPHVMEFLRNKEVVTVCPELLAGLGVPRTPIEIVNGALSDANGSNVDDVLRKTVSELVAQLKDQNFECAVLQSRSPTCGVNQIYDGTFSGKLIPGMGVFARALQEAGIRVIDAEDIGGTEFEL